MLSRAAKVDLFFLHPVTERRLHAAGEVVWKTEFGFAVRFLRMERELKSLILAVANAARPES